MSQNPRSHCCVTRNKIQLRKFAWNSSPAECTCIPPGYVYATDTALICLFLSLIERLQFYYYY